MSRANLTLILMMTAALSLCACGGKNIQARFAPPTFQILDGLTVSVADPIDRSGYTPKSDQEKIDLAALMKEALAEALKAKGYAAELGSAKLSVKTEILGYDPGNAAARWIMPGAGSTVLETVTDVFDADGKVVGQISVRRSVEFGGLLTIGAWKTVFKTVATDIANELAKVDAKQATAKSS